MQVSLLYFHQDSYGNSSSNDKLGNMQRRWKNLSAVGPVFFPNLCQFYDAAMSLTLMELFFIFSGVSEW